MASWQISRQPIRQGGAALLIVLAVATGTLTLAQRQSWTRSDHDQAAFGSGADVRAETSQPLSAAQAAALVQLPGVRHAMPVATFTETDTSTDILAIGSAQAFGVALLRPDQSPLAPASLFAKITPAGPAPGVTLPGRTGEVQLTAVLGPASLGLAPATVSVLVEDADSDVYQLDAGTLPADGRPYTLAVTLEDQAALAAGASPASPAAGASPPSPAAGAWKAIYPVRLTGVSLNYTLPAGLTRAPATFTVASVSGGPGTAQIGGVALRGWNTVASSDELVGARQAFGTSGPSGLPAMSSKAEPGHGALAATFSPGYGLAASGFGGPPAPIDGQLQMTSAPPALAIPGLATQRSSPRQHWGGIHRAGQPQRRGGQREDRRGGDDLPDRIRPAAAP